MNAHAVFLGERLSRDGRTVFALGAQTTIKPGETLTIEFESDKPVASSQRFDVLSGAVEVISIMAIDRTHFYATVRLAEPVEPDDLIGNTQEINGIRFTVTDVYAGSYQKPEGAEGKTGISTGAMIGVGVGVVAIGGGVIYLLATCKEKRRRRAA